MTLEYKRLRIILLSVPLLLMIPFIAMQFTNEVNWSPLDFLVMGVLLLGTGLVFEFILRKAKKEYRIVFLLAVLLLFFLVWAELAVGIFGTSLAGS